MTEQQDHYSPPSATLTDPNRPAAPPSVGQRVLGVLVGGIGVDLILGVSVSSVGTLIVMRVVGGDQSLTGTSALAASTVLSHTFSVLGGYTAAYIASWRPALMGLMAGATSGIITAPMLFLPGIEWGPIQVSGVILHLPLAAWGGHLAGNTRS